MPWFWRRASAAVRNAIRMTSEPYSDLEPASRPRPGGMRLLVVGAAPELRASVERWTEDLHLETMAAPDLPKAMRKLAADTWDVVIAVLGDTPADELGWWIAAVERLERRPRLLALVDRPSMDVVLRTSRLGWVEVLPLPPTRSDIRPALDRVRDHAAETRVPLPEVDACLAGTAALVGESPAMLEVYKLLAQVAPSTATVLIEGESGTGKEVVAGFIHANGPCARGPFVAVNCASIPESLLEGALFGHERGAFTGAVARRIGSFERAHGGTLFLDEVAEMGPALQAKILRAVQEREIERVGGDEAIPVNVRLIAATNRNVDEAVRDGLIREDLYYRLAVVRIRLPPLAQRRGDLMLLTAHFVREFAGRYGKEITAISDRALALLRRHRWVGNVRELRNVIERAAIVAVGDMIRAEHLPAELQGRDGESAPRGEVMTLAEAEARHIRHVLARTGGHITKAAEVLGIHRNTLARRMKRYGL